MTASSATRWPWIYRAGLVTATGLFAAMYLVTALPRVFYPYDLDYIEDSLLVEAQRFAAGLPVYTAPTSDFIAHVYMPFYLWLGGLLLKVIGDSFWPLRLLSLAATLLTAGLVGYVAARESQQGWLGWASAGLYLAGYRITGFWYELVRVDSMFVALSLLGLTLGIYQPARLGRAAPLVAALVLTLAFFTKQTALAFGLGLGLYLLLGQRRQAGLFGIVLLGLIGGEFALFNWLSQGWFYFQVVTVAGADEVRPGRVGYYFIFDLLGVMAGLSVMGVLAVLLAAWRAKWRVFAQEPWLISLGVAVVISAIARASVGGNVNNLMPVYALLCLAPALLWKQTQAQQHMRWQAFIGLAIVIQLALGVYYPPRYIPTPAMQAAGDRFVQRLKSYTGPVLVLMHPHYATLAGKSSSAQWPILWSLHFWLKQPILPSFVERLQKHYYAAIVSDESPTELDPDLQALLDQYYQVSLTLTEADAPNTLSGVTVRPKLIYIPK